MVIAIDFLLSAMSQFHQHFMSSIFVQKLYAQLFLYSKFGFILFWCKKIGGKPARKILVRLTPWLNNYINILVAQKLLVDLC
jgi:hypothetical protein